MRILLVNPPLSGEERYGAFAGSGTYLPPLSLAYLAAAVEGAHDVRILDAAAEELTLAADRDLPFGLSVVRFVNIVGTRGSVIETLTAQIAAAIDALPETLSRLLLKLKDEGVIRWEDDTLTIRSGFWREKRDRAARG